MLQLLRINSVSSAISTASEETTIDATDEITTAKAAKTAANYQQHERPWSEPTQSLQ